MNRDSRRVLYGLEVWGTILALAGAGMFPMKTWAMNREIIENTCANEIFATEMLAKETLVYTGPIFLEGEEEEYPEEWMEQSGKMYQLVSVELQTAMKSGNLTYISTTVPYELEGRQQPPSTATILLEDEVTGESYEREVGYLETIEKDAVWDTGFSFPITVSGYEAEVFLLGDTEVLAGADLSDFGEELLEYLDLPVDCYKVDFVEWDGESYEKEGTVCRDAIAHGGKLVRHVEVKYGGQIRTPEVEGKQYVAIYEEVIEETETEVVIRETENVIEEADDEGVGEEERMAESLWEMVREWVTEHITIVVFGTVFFVGILVVVVLLYLSRQRDDLERRKAGN